MPVMIDLICDNPACRSPFTRQLSEAKRWTQHFCKNRCKKTGNSSYPMVSWLPPIEIAAWHAAFVDGEGCITIINFRKENRRRVIVGVYNTCLPVLESIKSDFCGHSRIDPTKMDRPYQKQPYKWCVTSYQAVSYLKPLIPYLRIKRRQAEIVIDFQSIFQEDRFSPRANMLLEELRRLNKRAQKPA